MSTGKVTGSDHNEQVSGKVQSNKGLSIVFIFEIKRS